MRTITATLSSLVVGLVVTAGCFSSSHHSHSSLRAADGTVARGAPLATAPAATAPAAKPPVGALGLPLGTVARVRAVVVAGRDLYDKAHQGQYLLRVTHVNDRELAGQPVCEFGVPAYLRKNLARTDIELFEMKHGRSGRPVRSLSRKQIDALEREYVGKAFVLDVYETGRFDGIPRNMPPDVMPWQDRGFGFRTSLVVLAER